MTLRFATDSEIAEWDTHVLTNPDHGNVFQGDLFAEQKKLGSWKPIYLMADKLAILVLQKHVIGLGNMWYIPKGPGVDTPRHLTRVLQDLRGFASKQNVFAVKIESELPKTEENTKTLTEAGLLHVRPIQPMNSTILLDLRPELDDILSGLNQKGRHAINRAKRDGATVKRVETDDENCRLFYEMFSTTAKAQGFVIRPFEYYAKFWRRYADADMGQMFFTYNGDNLIACGFAMVFGEKSLYKDAASIRDSSVYGAGHLMQWEIIKWAREQGSKIHDLGGSPPSDKALDKNHPHYGIGRFKTSFNKEITDWIGAYDMPIKSTQYGIWQKFGERLVKRFWWKKHGESWY